MDFEILLIVDTEKRYNTRWDLETPALALGNMYWAITVIPGAVHPFQTVCMLTTRVPATVRGSRVPTARGKNLGMKMG